MTMLNTTAVFYNINHTYSTQGTYNLTCMSVTYQTMFQLY
jgi:hypothetical protein